MKLRISMARCAAFSCVYVAAALGMRAAAAAPVSMQVDITGCMDVGVPAERLSCYDALGEQVRRKKQLAASPAAATAAAVAAAAAPAPAPAQPGDPGRQTAPGAAPRDERQELYDKVAALEALPPDGRWVITLRDGQLWRQTVAEKFNLKVGYSVRIYPSKWGSGYRLTAQEIHGFIQVERLNRR